MRRGTLVFSDRYSALGIPLPDPKTVCRGKCEGIGFYPVKIGGSWVRALTDAENKAWKEIHAAEIRKSPRHERDCDGWHFIRSAECGGTGKRPEGETR